MTYPTRQECDKSFDEQWQGKGINTIQIFGEIKSHISTLRKNDVAFLRERVGEMRKHETSAFHTRDINQLSTTEIGLVRNKGYNTALTDILSLLTECEEKLK